MKKFNVFVGNYGSGKTEISINTALMLSQQGKTILVDLDIVNPYFRASEHSRMLNSNGIDVVKPCYANTLVDVPSLPAEIYKPFDGNYDYAVFDVGGDPVGAAALGILKDKFNNQIENTDVFYVVNTLRPLQRTVDEIAEMLTLIEERSGLKVTGLINNTNIALETTQELILEGQKIVAQVSEQMGIPIRYICVMRGLGAGLGLDNVIEIDLRMRPDWIDKT